MIQGIKNTELQSQLISQGIEVKYKKDSLIMKMINFFVKVFCKDFMEKYTTTIHHTIFVSENFDSLTDRQQYVILLHELVHVKQYEKWGPLFDLAYLFPPAGITFRYYFEREAYMVSFRLGTDLDHIVRQLVGPNYLYAGAIFPGRKATRDWFLRGGC